MYWDEENKPSVESPIGDFFGIGHSVVKHYISLPLTMTTARGFNCYFPMPFNDLAEIEIVNECDTEIRAFYYHIDYELYDKLDDDIGYFHAKWRRERPKAIRADKNLDGKHNYLILYAEGRGQYIGCILSIHGLRPGWWGEGDDMIFVDGETWPPSVHGTGTEDYFGAAWGFAHEFYGPYHGLPLRGEDDWTGYFSMYRFHIEDPIVFRKSIKVTIEHGHANDRSDDISSVAYWYQVEPHIEFSKMPPPEDRIPLPPRTPKEILSEVLEDLEAEDLTDQIFWKYVHALHLLLKRISKLPPETLQTYDLLSQSMWRTIYDRTIRKGDVDKAKKILIDIYKAVINSLR